MLPKEVDVFFSPPSERPTPEGIPYRELSEVVLLNKSREVDSILDINRTGPFVAHGMAPPTNYVHSRYWHSLVVIEPIIEYSFEYPYGSPAILWLRSKRAFYKITSAAPSYSLFYDPLMEAATIAGYTINTLLNSNIKDRPTRTLKDIATLAKWGKYKTLELITRHSEFIEREIRNQRTSNLLTFDFYRLLKVPSEWQKFLSTFEEFTFLPPQNVVSFAENIPENKSVPQQKNPVLPIKIKGVRIESPNDRGKKVEEKENTSAITSTETSSQNSQLNTSQDRRKEEEKENLLEMRQGNSSEQSKLANEATSALASLETMTQTHHPNTSQNLSKREENKENISPMINKNLPETRHDFTAVHLKVTKETAPAPAGPEAIAQTHHSGASSEKSTVTSQSTSPAILDNPEVPKCIRSIRLKCDYPRNIIAIGLPSPNDSKFSCPFCGIIIYRTDERLIPELLYSHIEALHSEENVTVTAPFNSLISFFHHDEQQTTLKSWPSSKKISKVKEVDNTFASTALVCPFDSFITENGTEVPEKAQLLVLDEKPSVCTKIPSPTLPTQPKQNVSDIRASEIVSTPKKKVKFDLSTTPRSLPSLKRILNSDSVSGPKKIDNLRLKISVLRTISSDNSKSQEKIASSNPLVIGREIIACEETPTPFKDEISLKDNNTVDALETEPISMPSLESTKAATLTSEQPPKDEIFLKDSPAVNPNIQTEQSSLKSEQPPKDDLLLKESYTSNSLNIEVEPSPITSLDLGKEDTPPLEQPPKDVGSLKDSSSDNALITIAEPSPLSSPKSTASTSDELSLKESNISMPLNIQTEPSSLPSLESTKAVALTSEQPSKDETLLQDSNSIKPVNIQMKPNSLESLEIVTREQSSKSSKDEMSLKNSPNGNVSNILTEPSPLKSLEVVTWGIPTREKAKKTPPVYQAFLQSSATSNPLNIQADPHSLELPQKGTPTPEQSNHSSKDSFPAKGNPTLSALTNPIKSLEMIKQAHSVNSLNVKAEPSSIKSSEIVQNATPIREQSNPPPKNVLPAKDSTAINGSNIQTITKTMASLELTKIATPTPEKPNPSSTEAPLSRDRSTIKAWNIPIKTASMNTSEPTIKVAPTLEQTPKDETLLNGTQSSNSPNIQTDHNSLKSLDLTNKAIPNSEQSKSLSKDSLSPKGSNQTPAKTNTMTSFELTKKAIFAARDLSETAKKKAAQIEQWSIKEFGSVSTPQKPSVVSSITKESILHNSCSRSENNNISPATNTMPSQDSTVVQKEKEILRQHAIQIISDSDDFVVASADKSKNPISIVELELDDSTSELFKNASLVSSIKNSEHSEELGVSQVLSSIPPKETCGDNIDIAQETLASVVKESLPEENNFDKEETSAVNVEDSDISKSLGLQNSDVESFHECLTVDMEIDKQLKASLKTDPALSSGGQDIKKKSSKKVKDHEARIRSPKQSQSSYPILQIADSEDDEFVTLKSDYNSKRKGLLNHDCDKEIKVARLLSSVDIDGIENTLSKDCSPEGSSISSSSSSNNVLNPLPGSVEASILSELRLYADCPRSSIKCGSCGVTKAITSRPCLYCGEASKIL